jgi:uncharacterized membrane protein HdeD (DUF308 family)
MNLDPLLVTPRGTAWWLYLLYGIAAVLFAIVTLFSPGNTIYALMLAFGALSLVDGVVSLASVFRKEVLLPNSLLVLYAVLSIGFGLLAIFKPLAVATAFLWVLALWLLIAGIARIVFAVAVRKVVNGEWLLVLSGVLTILLGVLFFAKPGLSMEVLMLWVAAGVLVYGLLQIAMALRLRKRQKRMF